MKQRIDSSQLQELTPSQQEKLRAWWEPQKGDWFVRIEDTCNHLIVKLQDNLLFSLTGNGYAKENCLPLLPIGQCIELLGDDLNVLWNRSGSKVEYEVGYMSKGNTEFSRSNEPIDALWEAVKDKLSRT